MLRSICVGVTLLLCVAGCGSDDSSPAAGEAMVGGDRDEHGCIGSAGYQWCERTAQCERPWELAASAGFDNTAEAFDAYCKSAE